jgi:hypothetical protein
VGGAEGGVEVPAVKRPKSGYQLFSDAERPNLPASLKPTEKMKELAARWKALSPEQKESYASSREGTKAGEGL